MKYPQFQDGSFASSFKLGLYDYMSLLTTRSKCFLRKTPLSITANLS